MTSLPTMAMLNVRLNIARQTLENLLQEIDRIEADTKVPANQRLEELKKIRQQIDKVGTEIDNINKEITLLNSYRVN